jgi:multimeric flavodoxin WrbA
MGNSKIVIVKESPRKFGNSAILAGQVASGAEAVGAQVESFYLHGMDIQPCDACDSCQGVREIDCITVYRTFHISIGLSLLIAICTLPGGICL